METPSGLLPASLVGRVESALSTARKDLLGARTADGYWRGELSSSALSTATAITALAVVDRESGGDAPRFKQAISQGLSWLAAHPHDDGGWGDTTRSPSNISTTTLVWAAFGATAGADERFRAVVDRAEQWLRQRARRSVSETRSSKFEIKNSKLESRGVDIQSLVDTLMQRYGKDRTFSVPILTLCALSGRLGTGRQAWHSVKPLPFELAALPSQWFAALRLPVVSYALPALIAIGQARHFHRPSRNPLVRFWRNLARLPTLRVLEQIQPASGGFLEATPLTSFVVMSLAGSGQGDHPVTRKGLEFLLKSQRADGSWAIDSDLATWTTTLSTNALASSTAGLEPELAIPVGNWLLGQQFRTEHPYTHAAPGGWAWTDLPGGVPDADDTAGAIQALVQVQQTGPSLREPALAAVRQGALWLADLQNRDGGVPTFCRGWGALPFDRSSADISAHAIRAWLDARPFLSAPEQRRIDRALKRAVEFLGASQRQNGAWAALWFGNQFAPGEENLVYGTSRVACALAELAKSGACPAAAAALLTRGRDWLLQAQNPGGGWGGAPGGPPSVEETALALDGLARAASLGHSPSAVVGIRKGAEWLVARVESGEWKNPAPIGLYFARLWYYEKLYPQIFTVGALGSVLRLEGVAANVPACLD